MNNIIKFLVAIQISLIIFGVFQLSLQDYNNGLFNIILNIFGLLINIDTLKKQ